MELILDLLEFKAAAGMPTYSYWLARSNSILKPWTRLEAATLKRKWMNIAGRVNGVMTAFLALLDYPPDQFQCCKDPEVVCIDGIVLSVESRRIRTATPWVDPRPIKCRFSKKEDRSIVTLRPDQKEILKAFIKHGISLQELGTISSQLDEPLSSFLFHSGELVHNQEYCTVI